MVKRFVIIAIRLTNTTGYVRYTCLILLLTAIIVFWIKIWGRLFIDRQKWHHQLYLNHVTMDSCFCLLNQPYFPARNRRAWILGLICIIIHGLRFFLSPPNSSLFIWPIQIIQLEDTFCPNSSLFLLPIQIIQLEDTFCTPMNFNKSM